MHELYELKDKLLNELSEYGTKDELTSGTLDIIDKLAHTVKNLCKIMEYSDYSERDYSRRGSYDDGSTRGSYRDGSYDDGSFRGSYGDSSMRDGSYARGRGRNAKRDSMGRYSTDSNMMLDRIHDMMAEAPDERTRQELQKFMTRLEQM